MKRENVQGKRWKITSGFLNVNDKLFSLIVPNCRALKSMELCNKRDYRAIATNVLGINGAWLRKGKICLCLRVMGFW